MEGKEEESEGGRERGRERGCEGRREMILDRKLTTVYSPTFLA